MDKTQEPPKKCFCARCFLPIEDTDKVEIEGQNFHRFCSMCCICRTIPSSLKMFYGHVFCNECFKTHVLTRFRGEAPKMHSNSWWMQWAPGAKPMTAASETKDSTATDPKPEGAPEQCAQEQCAPEEPPRRCICARCLQAVEDTNKVEIAGQSFHPQCAKCYFCHCVPTTNPKIYYGQVFCEECFHKHVISKNKDNPSEFFKNCFEQWQNNSQFAENMKEFMGGSKDNAPFIFMMQGQQPPFCRCGTGPQESWFQNNEPKKSATPAVSIGDESLGTWDLSFENRTEVSDYPDVPDVPDIPDVLDSHPDEPPEHAVFAAEKIEKLTKYLHEIDEGDDKCAKKWKNVEFDKMSTGSEPFFFGWVDLREPRRAQPDCPKCLWQCGPICVNSEYLQVCCGDVSR